jgi:hypothetical protein
MNGNELRLKDSSQIKISHLFLDVDGVLNNTMSETWFDAFNVANFKFLWAKLGEPIVILSSDWRRRPESLEEVKWAIMPIVLGGSTKFDDRISNRPQEIKEFLESTEWSAAIILDDMQEAFVDPEMDNVFFFRMQHQFGLTEDDVDFIISYLRELK